MENEHGRGDGCGWTLLVLFPILFLIGWGALTGQIPPLTSTVQPAGSPVAILEATAAPAPVVVIDPPAAPVYPTAAPVVIYPTVAPAVIRPAPTWPPASEGDPAQSAGGTSSWPAPSLAWQVVGWLLAGLIGLGGLAGLGVLLYRQVLLARATAAAIRAQALGMGNMAPAPAGDPAPASDDAGPRASGEAQPAEDGRPVDVQAYLEHA